MLLGKGNSSTLLTDSSCLDCRHEEEEMAYTEAKPCQLPGVLGDWHPPLPATKDGNGNISDTWIYSCISNATWIIAARAPEGQLSSALQPVAGLRESTWEGRAWGRWGLQPSFPCPLSLCLHNCKSAQVIMIVYEISQSNNVEYNILNIVI